MYTTSVASSSSTTPPSSIIIEGFCEDFSCPICYETPIKKDFTFVITTCLHNLCQDCYTKLREPKKCPTCNIIITVSEKNLQYQNMFTAAVAVMKRIQSMIPAPPSPPPDREAALVSAMVNMRDFIDSPWSVEAKETHNLKPEDFDLVWPHDPKLCDEVLKKIYTRLQYFFTDRCGIAATESLPYALSIFNNLCILCARPRLAAAEHSIAQFCYGYCLTQGIIMEMNEENTKRGRALIEKASRGGVALAHYHLGLFHEKEGAEDFAVACFEKGMQQNYFECHIALAKRLIGNEETRPDALSYVQQAAAQGHIHALELLGDYLADGTATGKPDPSAAYEKYSDASVRGNKSRALQQKMEGCKNAYVAQNPGTHNENCIVQ